MPSGILIIDKSPGWTSQDAAAKLRGLYGERRVGHGGTLDPMATGVLPVFLGRATRAVEFFEHAEKEYIAGLRLGIATDTEDTTGTVLAEGPVEVTEARVREAVAALRGEREQVPPMYSAVKIGGRKLYELARAGKQVERKPRRITALESELLDGGGEHWRFRVLCSKGTYVRTLCRELGDALGCPACMESLRRTRAGCFDLTEAHTMDEIMSMAPEARLSLLLPVDSLFSRHPALRLTENQTRRVKYGGDFSLGGADGTYRFYGPDDEFLALGRVEAGTASTIKSFFEVN